MACLHDLQAVSQQDPATLQAAKAAHSSEAEAAAFSGPPWLG
jgi:hypothetical protein